MLCLQSETTENIAIEIWDLLAPKLALGKLHRIRLHEFPLLNQGER